MRDVFAVWHVVREAAVDQHLLVLGQRDALPLGHRAHGGQQHLLESRAPCLQVARIPLVVESPRRGRDAAALAHLSRAESLHALLQRVEVDLASGQRRAAGFQQERVRALVRVLERATVAEHGTLRRLLALRRCLGRVGVLLPPRLHERAAAAEAQSVALVAIALVVRVVQLGEVGVCRLAFVVADLLAVEREQRNGLAAVGHFVAGDPVAVLVLGILDRHAGGTLHRGLDDEHAILDAFAELPHSLGAMLQHASVDHRLVAAVARLLGDAEQAARLDVQHHWPALERVAVVAIGARWHVHEHVRQPAMDAFPQHLAREHRNRAPASVDVARDVGHLGRQRRVELDLLGERQAAVPVDRVAVVVREHRARDPS